MVDENHDVEQAVVEPTNQQEVSQEQSTPEESREPKEGSQEYNFREMRKVVEEQQRRIKELESRTHVDDSEEEAEDSEELGEDDLLTVKQAKKLALKEAQGLIKQQEFSNLEDKMRIKFKDYDDVVSEENIKKLIEDDGDIADSIRRASNPYATAYKMIKKSVFYMKDQELQSKKFAEAERIQKNAQRPGSSNSVNTKPLAQANTFASMSKAERDALNREMTDCANRRI